MTTPLDPSVRGLSSCGCCAGIGPSTPGVVFNRPGLRAIAYRSGTWHEFKESLIADLAGSQHPELAGLTTRADDDLTIALLDAVAACADVLTFYQERIANEAYLRTATERRSVLELARLIGYELGPGAAAGMLLAFTVDDTLGAPRVATIDVGVKIQSVPGHGEKPQTFETVEKIEGRAEWNAMTPALTLPQAFAATNVTDLWLAGIATGLRVGDAVLLVGAERAATAGDDHWDVRLVRSATIAFDDKRTHVLLGGSLRTPGPASTWSGPPTVYALRTRAGIFGNNAPDWKSMSKDFQETYLGKSPILPAEKGQWKDFTIFSPGAPAATATSGTIDLDFAHPSVVPTAWLVLATPDKAELFSVNKAIETSRAQFAVSAKTTRIGLDGANLTSFNEAVRETTVLGENEALPLAGSPIVPAETGIVTGLTLATDIGDLPSGRPLLLTGVDAATGEPAVEAVTLDHLEAVGDATRLVFTTALEHSYRLASLMINGNVARATQGETVDEVLGGGDAGRPYQRFPLRQPPLTFVRSKGSPSGVTSSLGVRVNDVLWTEAPSFYSRAPDEHVFVARRTDDGTTAVQFGDGVHGARLPTGQENVRAHYRKGIGLGGNVKAGQLTTLLTRPLGLKSGSNPGPATGGDDPEPRDAARENAPLTVMTLDRVVSLRDYEDFARAYAGIAKALATWTWDGQRRGVFITVAGPDGAAVADDIVELLLGQIRASGDRFVPLRVATYRQATFALTFRAKVDPAYERAAVDAALVDSLRSAFGFDSRAFGQAVALSEVIATLQAVTGVVAVDIDALDRTDGVGGSGLDQPLLAGLPETASLAGSQAAELLTLGSDPIVPGDMT